MHTGRGPGENRGVALLPEDPAMKRCLLAGCCFGFVLRAADDFLLGGD